MTKRGDLSEHLPRGMNENAFVDAVAHSGYPLQMYAAQVLKDRGFWVHEEWAYTDRGQDQRRAIDVLGGRSQQRFESAAGESVVGLELLVECKRSRHPFVFFEAVNPPVQTEHPSPIYNPGLVRLRPADAGEPGQGQWYSEVPLGAALDFDKLPFLAGVPIAASMSTARARSDAVEMSGDEAYRELFLPLTKAAQEHRALRKSEAKRKGPSQFIDVPLAVALVDAPVFMVRGPDSPPEPMDWVRIFVRAPVDPERHAWRNPRAQFVEVVRKPAFVRFIEAEVSAFITELERRIADHHQVVLTGDAYVAGLTRGEHLGDGVLKRLVSGP